MIKLKDFNFTFSSGFNLAVENLEIPEGGVFTIIGPNGAGKTSLLNVFALFQRINRGSLEIFGKGAYNPGNMFALRRAMSFVFSEPFLLNDTVFNNVALPLKFRGRMDGARVNEMLEFFRIINLQGRKANSLSQGEKHRVSLARAFVTQPRLVLLDEPFLSLDPKIKESLIADLRAMIKLNKITAVLVTQDQFEALSLADTMAVMMNGRILQQARPEDIFSKPASKEIADFVGVETILEGRVTKKEDSLCSVSVKERILEAVSEYNRGDEVFVCIRPEDVTVSLRADKDSARNHFSAKVSALEPWRLEYKVSLDCGFNLIAAVTKQSVGSLGLSIGREVFVSFKATAIHLIRR